MLQEVGEAEVAAVRSDSVIWAATLREVVFGEVLVAKSHTGGRCRSRGIVGTHWTCVGRYQSGDAWSAVYDWVTLLCLYRGWAM